MRTALLAVGCVRDCDRPWPRDRPANLRPPALPTGAACGRWSVRRCSTARRCSRRTDAPAIPGVREFPPYTDEYEAKLSQEHRDASRPGTFPDPISVCGVPHGFPAHHERAGRLRVCDRRRRRPTSLAENGPSDPARSTPTAGSILPAEELWGTYTGASVRTLGRRHARLRNRRPQGIARQRRDRRSHGSRR